MRALWGAWAAGQEKKGELATTSLELNSTSKRCALSDASLDNQVPGLLQIQWNQDVEHAFMYVRHSNGRIPTPQAGSSLDQTYGCLKNTAI